MIRIIVSGGGTGGHIFPALSIANALKRLDGEIEILFVGAEGKMEMEKVPEAGFPIEGLPVRGLQRRLTWQNVKVLVNLCRSLRKARKIIKRFRPDVVVGVGGYASGPIGQVASRMGVPLVLQEQNSYAGVTNKLLAKKAKKYALLMRGWSVFSIEKKLYLPEIRCGKICYKPENRDRKDLLIINWIQRKKQSWLREEVWEPV